MIRPVDNRAKWLLHELESYEPNIPDSFFNEYGLTIPENDKALGVYTNFFGIFKDIVVVTNLGLYVGTEGQWNYVTYESMEHVRFPNMRKENFIYLRIILKNGDEFILPTINRTPGHADLSYLDIYAFEKFLSGIIMGLEIDRKRKND